MTERSNHRDRRDSSTDGIVAIAGSARAAARKRDLDARVVDRWLGVRSDLTTSQDAGPAEIGSAWERLVAEGPGDRWARKASNLFVTPAQLADRMAESLWPREEGPGPVLDPACGTGALLLAVIRRARRLGTELRADQLAGTDIDPRAVALCRCAVWLELANPDLDPDVIERSIRVADAIDVPPGDGEGREQRLILNPPWDLDRWDPRPFLERFDPDHRLRSRPDAERVRAELDQNPECRALLESERQRFLERARRLRARYPAAEGPGSVNLAHLFVARAMELLSQDGRAVLLIPSAIRTDLGPKTLRRTLLDEFEIESWLGFENHDRAFPRVDSRFRFDLLTIRKAAPRPSFRCAFFLRASDNTNERDGLELPRKLIERLSPTQHVIPEPSSEGEVATLEHLVGEGVLLGEDPIWDLEVRRELDLTHDSDRYETIDDLEADGFVAIEEGSWIQSPTDDRALPLLEGRMIDAFDPDAKNWVGGHGRRAKWQAVAPDDPSLRPQFLVPEDRLRHPADRRIKVGLMAVGSATNTRTAIAAPLPDLPCANSVVTLRSRDRSAVADLNLCAVLNSFVYDWALRRRMAGLNLNRFLLRETLLPRPERIRDSRALALIVARLSWVHPRYDAAWAILGQCPRPLVEQEQRRRARAAIDAVVAQTFGLSTEQFRAVVSGDDRRSFRRVDAELPHERRATTEALRAFERLTGSNASIDGFLGAERLLD